MPVVIDFWAPQCEPCKIISPIFEEFSNSADFELIGFYKVDTDAQEDIAQEVGIVEMPTFISFANGGKIGEYTGDTPEELENLITTSA